MTQVADMTNEIQRLIELSGKATPGEWSADPKRLVVNGIEGPIMSYLVGDGTKPEGMKVSLGSERLADHHLVATLVNFFRAHAPALLEAVKEDEYDQKAVSVIRNLAMLVRRLCHNHPNEKLTDQAMAYLRGEKLEGSVLRTDAAIDSKLRGME